MFCDLVNSIGLSHRLDPEDLRDVIAAYQRACLEAIQRYDGYVAKYIGDGILAFFGYPSAREDAAESSLRAGLAVVQAVPRLNAELRRTYGVEVAVRVGIATGLVVVGDIVEGGVAERDAVTGEAANLAARLQAVAEPNKVLVSAPTRQLAAEGFEYQDLGMQELKGFDKPIHVYQVVYEKVVSRLEARSGSFAPFVGRHHELARICDCWEQVLSGKGQAVAIIGDAGIGKSRLALEACSRISLLQRDRGLVEPSVLTFQCSAHHTNTSFFPLVRRVEEATAIHKHASNAKKIDALEASLNWHDPDCGEHLWFLAKLLGLKPGRSSPTLAVGPAETRHLTIEALKFWCASHRENRLLVVVFEDVQWIDPTSKLFLTHLSYWAKDHPILIVVTMRPDRVRQTDVLVQAGLMDARDQAPSYVSLCELPHLPEAETRTLIAAVAAGKSIASTDEETILKRSQGIPLYVEELTKRLISASADVPELDNEPPSITSPNTLSDALMARLDELGPTKETAQQASVIGQEFSIPLLARITAKSPRELVGDVETLLSSELVVRSLFAPLQFRFKHTLFHEIAYESLLKKTRRELHCKIADELVHAADYDISARDDVIASHYSLAGFPERSVPLWLRAAKEAISRSAHEEALAMLGSAHKDLKKLGAITCPSVELDIVLARATALRAISGYSAPGVRRALTEARELCETCKDTNTRFNVDWGLFQGNLVSGNVCTARALADQLLMDSSRHPELPRVDALLADGMAAFHAGDFDRARHSFQAGVAMSRPESDEPHFFTHGQNPGVFCLSYLAHTQCFLGELDQARETIERSIAISELRARQAAHIYGYVNALTFAVRVHEFCGETAREEVRARQILDISRRNAFRYYEAVSTCHLAWTTGLGGNLADGISQMTDGIAALERTGTSLSVQHFFVLLAELHIRAHHLAEAELAIERAITSKTSRTHAWDAEIERVRGDIIAMKPCADIAEAISAYQASLSIARHQKARLFALNTTASLARQLQRMGRQDEARVQLGKCLQQLREGFDTLPAQRAQALRHSL